MDSGSLANRTHHWAPLWPTTSGPLSLADEGVEGYVFRIRIAHALGSVISSAMGCELSHSFQRRSEFRKVA
jgi:hypothetical protein